MLDRDQLQEIVERVLQQAAAATAGPTLLLRGADGWRHEQLTGTDPAQVAAVARGDDDAFVWIEPEGEGRVAVLARTLAGDEVAGVADAADGWRLVPAAVGTLDAVRERLVRTVLDRS
jgi:hypothetical protein